MPIRFHCKRCRQLLGIAARKAGTQIECPKCGISQTVPNEEAALAALAMDRFAKTHETYKSGSSVVVYEDQPAAIESPRLRPAEEDEPSVSARNAPGASPIQVSGGAGQPVPQGVILYPRRTLYVQGVLFLVLGLGTFTAGYFIGRGDANWQLLNQREEIEKVNMPIEGRLVYDPGSGKRIGDEGAAVIALSAEESPRRKIPIDGLRPEDPLHTPPRQSVQLVRDLGGQYTRVKASGEFRMVVPDKGAYQLLIISNNTTRAGGADVDEVDLSEMGVHFTQPDALIGRHKYYWLRIEVNAGLDRIEKDFGRDRQ